MTDPPQPSPAEAPDAAAIAFTAEEDQLLAWLQDPGLDVDEIARRLVTDADRDPSD